MIPSISINNVFKPAEFLLHDFHLNSPVNDSFLFHAIQPKETLSIIPTITPLRVQERMKHENIIYNRRKDNQCKRDHSSGN